MIITFIVAIILALPGFITELSNISERITPPPPINEIDNNTTEKNVPDPNPAGNNTYSLHTFTGGFVNIKDSTSEECHLYPGKYILKVSELDKKIKLEIRTKDKVIFSDIVSNMEKEIKFRDNYKPEFKGGAK